MPPNFYYDVNKRINCNVKHESIPIGCVPPAFLVRGVCPPSHRQTLPCPWMLSPHVGRPPFRGQTNTRENITLPKLRLRPVNMFQTNSRLRLFISISRICSKLDFQIYFPFVDGTKENSNVAIVAIRPEEAGRDKCNWIHKNTMLLSSRSTCLEMIFKSTKLSFLLTVQRSFKYYFNIPPL